MFRPASCDSELGILLYPMDRTSTGQTRDYTVPVVVFFPICVYTVRQKHSRQFIDFVVEHEI